MFDYCCCFASNFLLAREFYPIKAMLAMLLGSNILQVGTYITDTHWHFYLRLMIQLLFVFKLEVWNSLLPLQGPLKSHCLARKQMVCFCNTTIFKRLTTQPYALQSLAYLPLIIPRVEKITFVLSWSGPTLEKIISLGKSSFSPIIKGEQAHTIHLSNTVSKLL